MSKGKFEIADVLTVDTTTLAANWTTPCTFDVCPPLALIHTPILLHVGVLFLIFFILVLLPQPFLGIRHRNHGFIVTLIIGLILEIIGYGARVQLTVDSSLRVPFLLSLVCFILGPVFINGSIGFFFSRVAAAYGDLPERKTKIRKAIVLFACVTNLVSLVVDAVGCVYIAMAVDEPSLLVGVKTLLAGYAMQASTSFLFLLLCFAFYLRRDTYPTEAKGKAIKHAKASLSLISFTAICLIIRCIYCAATLPGDFFNINVDDSPLNTEFCFVVFDSTMVLLACMVLSFAHPAKSAVT